MDPGVRSLRSERKSQLIVARIVSTRICVGGLHLIASLGWVYDVGWAIELHGGRRSRESQMFKLTG